MTPVTRLPHADHLRHLRTESARFRAAIADCDPDARVPSCPDWSAADLLGHLAAVQHFWATIVEQRPVGPEDLEEPERPPTYDGLLAWFDEHSARLLAALAAADPAEPAWTWADDQTVGFIFRRQAHEALIHRLDAELASGSVTPLDPALAADGVDEALDVMFGGKPPWGSFAASGDHVRVDLTDRGECVWVQLGRFTGTRPEGGEVDVDDIVVVADPGRDADAVVSGTAGAVDAWLWRRVDEAEVTAAGSREVYERFHRCVDQPID